MRAAAWASDALRAVGFHLHRVEGGGAANEEVVALGPTELDVGNDLRDEHLADQGAVRIVDMDAIAGAGPDPAVDIEPEAIEKPGGTGREDLTSGQRVTAVDREPSDVARTVRTVGGPGIRDI